MVLRLAAAIVSAALLAASAIPALAQSTSATIRGIVKDDTGALPGASIVAKETASGFSFDCHHRRGRQLHARRPAPRHLRHHGDDEPVQAGGAEAPGAGRPEHRPGLPPDRPTSSTRRT